MKTIADFLVERRRILLSIIIVITIVCGIMTTKVAITEDRSDYLADDSNMKQGLQIMEAEFPETEESSSIRVMFEDLENEQIGEIEKKLENIPNVSSVTYDADSKNYNKGNKTLFVVNSDFDYNSDEEQAIEAAIETEFSEYKMTYQNNDTPTTELPAWIIITALALLVGVLLLMCNSWLDPVLILVTIGFAVIINMGTNAILPYIDEMTMTVGPILQLVLSMDYSIILLSRYRLEKQNHSKSTEAMKTALAGSISSIFSSCMTTVAGLLALVFLSFKLGPELGIVLAKGVLISMLCVFTILPVLILKFDKWLEKTRKHAPRIPMGRLSRFSYKARHIMPVIFAALLTGSFILQGFTTITFTESSEDPLADIFPKENNVVVVYNNNDEDKISEIISELEKDRHISSVTGYTNTLGEERTVSEMHEAISSMDGDVDLDEDMLKMLYFAASDEELPTMTAAEFMNFINDTILPNETFAEHFDEDITENIEYFKKFSDKDALTTPLTASEMASFFGIEEDSLQQLYLYYAMRNGVADSGSMTLPAFVDFVLNTVAKDETYGSMFDKGTLSSLEQMQMFTDKKTVTTKRTSSELATMLGVSEEVAGTVFVLHNAGDVSDKKMTLLEFSTFLCEDMMNDPMFGANFDEATKAQVQSLHSLIQLAASGQALPAQQMAQVMGMDAEQANGIYMMNSATEMTLPDFLNAALQLSPDEPQLQQMNGIVQLAASGASLDSKTLAQTFGMEENMVNTVFRLYFGADISGKTMSLKTFIDFILSDSIMESMMDKETVQQLQLTQSIINASLNGKKFTSKQLADFLGMDAAQAEQLYILYMSENGAVWKLSPQEFVDFAVSDVLGNKSFAGQFDQESAEDLKLAQTLIDAVVSGKSYTANEMAEMFTSMSDAVSEDEIEMMYIYYGGVNDANTERTMTIPQLFDYICDEMLEDERFTDFFDEKTRADILGSRGDLIAAIEQLRGDTYSRLIITSDYPDESTETYKYIENLNKLCKNNLGEYYLVGNSVLVSELDETFDNENTMITLITALAVLLVVLIAFRNPVLPVILTLLVQCSVFFTITVIGAYSGEIYYLALLIVQSILMGATIDYGIVFCNFYREYRSTMDVPDALKAAYEGAIHTIMTSGSILVLVLAILGICVSSPMISDVCVTLSIGSFVALLMILLVLPGMVACSDKLQRKRTHCFKNQH